MDDYRRWEAKKAELDRQLDELQVQFTQAKSRTAQSRIYGKFNRLAEKRQKMSSFVDWRE